MSAHATVLPTRRRPAPVLVTAGLLVFLGISASAGGVALVAGGAAPPDEWLDRIPLVDAWTIPGLVLGIGFGLGSLVTAYGMLRRPRWPWLGPVERLARHHWSWLATVLIGLDTSPGSPSSWRTCRSFPRCRPSTAAWASPCWCCP